MAGFRAGLEGVLSLPGLAFLPEDDLSPRAFFILLAAVEVSDLCSEEGVVAEEEEEEERVEDGGVRSDWGM